MQKISPPTGIPSPDRPGRSESLYQLSYRGPQYIVIFLIFFLIWVPRIFDHPVFIPNPQALRLLYATSGFRRYADDLCTLLGYYAASSGSSVPTFRHNLSAPIFKDQEVQEENVDFLTLEDETDRLCRNVGRELPLDAA